MQKLTKRNFMSESKINELALKSEILTNKSFSENSFDYFGGHLLMHLVKK